MNKSDKYYLKQGKLELSMLDDDDDEVFIAPNKSAQRKMASKIDEQNLFEHTKRLRDIKDNKQARVKVSQEIYSTLHTMGQYLTKNDDKEVNSLPAKKPMNAAKAQLIEQLASSVKVQDMTLPPMPSKEERLLNTRITRADEIVEKTVDISLDGRNYKRLQENEENGELQEERKWYKLEKEAERQDNAIDEIEKNSEEIDRPDTSRDSEYNVEERLEDNLVNEEKPDLHDEIEEKTFDLESEESTPGEIASTENTLIYDQNYSDEMERAVEQSYEEIAKQSKEKVNIRECLPEEEEEAETIREFVDQKHRQQNIDALVGSFFNGRVPQYSFTKDLKRHIDKHINSIKERKTNFTN